MILAFFLALSATDPAGWSKARWGMSQQEVLDAFPGQAVRLEEPLPSCTIGDDKAPLAIHQVQIGATNYRACFYFAAGQLTRVDLQPADRADSTDHEFDSLEALLVEKYLKPWQRRTADQFESRWSFPTTRISLTLLRLRVGTLQVRSLNLRYEQKSGSDNLD